jgi:hypothetical protein
MLLMLAGAHLFLKDTHDLRAPHRYQTILSIQQLAFFHQLLKLSLLFPLLERVWTNHFQLMQNGFQYTVVSL